MTDTASRVASSRMLPQTTFLAVIGAVSLLLATVLTLTATGITTRTWDEVGDEAAVAALTVWTQFAVILGITSLAGAIVLTGVAEVGRRVLLDIAQQGGSASE